MKQVLISKNQIKTNSQMPIQSQGRLSTRNLITDNLYKSGQTPQNLLQNASSLNNITKQLSKGLTRN